MGLSVREMGKFCDLIKGNFMDNSILNCLSDFHLGGFSSWGNAQCIVRVCLSENCYLYGRMLNYLNNGKRLNVNVEM